MSETSERIFNPTMSTDEIYRAGNTSECLTDDLDAIESDIGTLNTSVSSMSSTISGLGNTYALKNHTHSGYAATNHTHSQYATTEALNELSESIASTPINAGDDLNNLLQALQRLLQKCSTVALKAKEYSA